MIHHQLRNAFLLVLSLLLLSGCTLSGGSAPRTTEEPAATIRDATSADPALFASVLQLLGGDIAMWDSLPVEEQQQLWEVLVRGVPFPNNRISLMSVQQVATVTDAAVLAEDGGVAWQSLAATEVAPSRVDAEVGPKMPASVPNELRTPQPVDEATLSDVVGFDVGAEIALPSAPLSLDVPRETGLVASPIVVYHAVPFDVADVAEGAAPAGEGVAYEVAALYLVAFGVAR